MENTHKRRNISQLHQLTEVGACFDGKYFEIQQRLAARVARLVLHCSTLLRLGNKNKAGLEMNDLRKHETKLWSLEWSQIRFSLNFFPSFFLPQLRCWAALRPPRPNPLLRNRYQSKLNKSWIPWRKIFCDNVNKEITASLKFLFLKRKICASTFTPLPRLFLLWNLNPQ